MDMTPMRICTTDSTGDPYFAWLLKKAGIGAEKPYEIMALQLHSMIFKPTHVVQMDMVRAEDGLQLRVEFMDQYGPEGSSSNRGPCTMLEFLVGLARRMSFLMGEENQPSRTPYYFWKMIQNLGLLKATDSNPHVIFLTEDAVYRVLDRAYDRDGFGGLFPLRHPNGDQRKVEIWYQMQAWLAEHCAIDVS